MRVALVTPRYGPEVVGGAEHLARMVAERLKDHHQIEVLTTCAKDYRAWKNEYRSGLDVINGVAVRRFKNSRTRDLKSQIGLEDQLFCLSHSHKDELKWLERQGPCSKELISYIKEKKGEYECFVFFTFRYHPSYYGIELVGDKSLVAPFAENDPALDLEITEETFRRARGIIYSTPEERNLILKKVNFREEEKVWDMIGCGIEVIEPPKSSADLMDGDYILYLGRIDGSKGCYSLFDYYRSASEEFEEMPMLLLAGYDAIGVPKHNKIKYLGFVSEEEKFSLLKGAKFLVMPSPYESLSLVTLEAMASGTSVLVNGECDVLKGHCIRSNAGLWYQNYEEFLECSRLLSSSDDLRRRMGINGQRYVKENYRWDVVIEKYLRLIEEVGNEIC